MWYFQSQQSMYPPQAQYMQMPPLFLNTAVYNYNGQRQQAAFVQQALPVYGAQGVQTQYGFPQAQPPIATCEYQKILSI